MWSPWGPPNRNEKPNKGEDASTNYSIVDKPITVFIQSRSYPIRGIDVKVRDLEPPCGEEGIRQHIKITYANNGEAEDNFNKMNLSENVIVILSGPKAIPEVSGDEYYSQLT